jgi:hypothetical protein
MNYYQSICILLLVFSSSFGFSQTESTVHEGEDLRITSQEQFCEMKMGYDLDRTILTLENKSNDTLVVSWNLNLWFDNECLTCGHETDEYKLIVELAPLEIRTGSCSQEVTDKSVQFFSGFSDSNAANKTRLTKFELDELKVQKR